MANGDMEQSPSRREAMDVTDLKIPSCYVDGYRAARGLDPDFADAYIRHTTVGDPLADQVVEDLSSVRDNRQIHSIILEALSNHENPSEDTPASLRHFVADASIVPDWFSPEFALKATRAFLRDPEVVLAGLATGAIVEGFSTLISKPFRIRGRIISNGVRRLKQNNLQLLEQFIPGGLEPGGDGWKLNIRIRLVHAQSRRLIRESDEWDTELYGMPLSASHMLLGAAAFSGRLMQHVERLGGNFTKEEREAYVHVWRYAGIQLGVPDAIIFHDEDSARRAFEVAAACEPEPDEDAIVMANSIIQSTPIVLRITESTARSAKARQFYQISRELIGDDAADRFKFPPPRRIKLLPLIRQKRRIRRTLVGRIIQRLFSHSELGNFEIILDVSDLGAIDHSYALPLKLFDEDSQEW